MNASKMLKGVERALGLLFAILVQYGLTERLHNFKTCKPDSSDFNKCLEGAFKTACLNLKNGIPSLNIPPMDPLYVPNMIIGQGTGPVHVDQNLKDIYLSGLSDMKMFNVNASTTDGFRVYLETFTPKLQMRSRYSLTGRMLMLPIQGEGNATTILENAKGTTMIIGEKVTIKGKTYLNVKEYIVTIEPSMMHFNFENLFNGNEQLGSEMNNVMNQNWKDLFEDIKGEYNEAFGIIFRGYANHFLSKFPYKHLFPA